MIIISSLHRGIYGKTDGFSDRSISTIGWTSRCFCVSFTTWVCALWCHGLVVDNKTLDVAGKQQLNYACNQKDYTYFSYIRARFKSESKKCYKAHRSCTE